MRLFIAAYAAAIVLLAISAPAAHGFNITKILAQHPEFSSFNHYLSATRLANEINRRRTITILAVDNSGMSDLLSKHYSLLTIRNVLSLHILTDYYGARKLHQLTRSSTVASSVYQSSGDAPGTTGYINITAHRAGRVTFSADDSGGAAPVAFVKSVKEKPYDISVLQVSAVLSSPEADAPVAAPPPVNLTEIMSKKSCGAFANLLVTYGVEKTFESNLNIGLTVFCPIDAAVKAFAGKFKNLTSHGKVALLLYHGTPVYYSLQLLKSNNGDMATLATDAATKGYDFVVQNSGEVVTLETKVGTATVTSTILDQDPDAVYSIDSVLQPKELFKLAEAPAPAPAGTKKHKGKHEASPVPDGPEGEPADQVVADKNAASINGITGCWAASMATVLAVATLIVSV